MDAELEEVRDFLADHAPYDGLPPAVLSGLPSTMTMRYLRRGTQVLRLGSTNDVVSIIRSGAVDIHDEGGRLIERGDVGTTLGSSNVISGGPVQFDVTAIEDTLLLDLPAREFLDLVRSHPAFGTFFVQLLAARIRGAVASVQESEGGGAILKTHVRRMLRRPPVLAQSSATIQQAARIMADENASALLLLDGDQIHGIVTDRDLRKRVIAVGRDINDPVTTIMTVDPVTISADALAFEAVMEMVRHNIHHLPVLEDEVPIGLISSTDIVRLEQSNPVFLAGDVSRQQDLDGLVEASTRLPMVIDRLVSQDATAADIGRIVTAVGDGIERRLIDLAIAELGPPPVPYCWVVLGSKARGELGLGGDQDHALIISDAGCAAEAGTPDRPPGPAPLRQDVNDYFAALAERVAKGLAACGYPRCSGDVMATNPRWRLSVAGWQAQFTTWMQRPEPVAILHASIFFDMRAVHGDPELLRPLQRLIATTAPRSTLFLGHLAKSAVAHQAPLGFFRNFVLQGEGEHRDTLDLKWGGVGAVVELVRVFALSVGTGAVGTQARINAAVAAGKLTAERGTDLSDAFEFISYVRLRHQARLVREGLAPDNFVPPKELSTFEKRHLRDAFTIVRGTQQLLTQVYPLHYMS